jgi:hypothetical protein
MPIVQDKSGVRSYEGRESVEVFRLRALLSGLRLQKKGLRMSSRLPQATTICRRQYGLKGNIDKMIEQVEALVQEQLQKVVIVDEDADEIDTVETV